MAKRKLIDWESIEPLYRAGNLSNCEICRQYEADHTHSQTWKTTVTEAAIRKKAKENNWQKNLADKVKKQVRENLVRNDVRTSNRTNSGASDQEIIEQAAEVGSGVILRHRDEIAILLKHETSLLDELQNSPKKSYMANFQGQIISEDVELTVKEKSATLKDLAAVRAQRIALERQAYSLDDDSGNNRESMEDFLRSLD